MPNFSWMRSERFYTEIEDQVSNSAGRYGMRTYSPDIPKWLVEQLAERRTIRESEELRKPEIDQRSENNALQSVNLLMEYACEIAKREGRMGVVLQDAQTAYGEYHCQFWPFC